MEFVMILYILWTSLCFGLVSLAAQAQSMQQFSRVTVAAERPMRVKIDDASR
jgi:hypothetical protein